MVGQVDEGTRKERASILLAMATAARARFALRHVGSVARVLFEERRPDGRWVGHAEDHVLVAAASPDERDLENEIAVVELVGVDRLEPQRLNGAVLSFQPRGVGSPGPRDARGWTKPPAERPAAVAPAASRVG